MAAMDWRIPVSLFACITETSKVSGRNAAATDSGVTNPPGVTGKQVTSKPSRSKTCMGSSTALCSIPVVMTCRLPDSRPNSRSPKIARLLLSVAPLVKITSSRLAATTAATCSRAFCTACLALTPYTWVRLPSLPNSSVRKWNSTFLHEMICQTTGASPRLAPTIERFFGGRG